ncbi:MAG: tRNA (guanosine(46)-N7)-methyltransferase TrmB, partial [Flavobacteriaceae bacterium]
MGSKNKLKRFQENETFPNVIQPTRESLLQGSFEHIGHWKEYFRNDNPIIVELGCGKGEYTVAL